MPLELRLLSEGLSRDYSLQSYLSPAPLWLCTHTSAPSLGWLPSILVTTVWVWVITRPWLLPCAPPESFSLSARRNCLLLLCFAGKHLSRGYAVGCVAGCWQHSLGAQCSLCWALLCSHCVALERITAGRTAGESHVNLISVSCLTAFLLHFFCSKSFKEGISWLFCNNAFWRTSLLKCFCSFNIYF